MQTPTDSVQATATREQPKAGPAGLPLPTGERVSATALHTRRLHVATLQASPSYPQRVHVREEHEDAMLSVIEHNLSKFLKPGLILRGSERFRQRVQELLRKKHGENVEGTRYVLGAQPSQEFRYVENEQSLLIATRIPGEKCLSGDRPSHWAPGRRALLERGEAVSVSVHAVDGWTNEDFDALYLLMRDYGSTSETKLLRVKVENDAKEALSQSMKAAGLRLKTRTTVSQKALLEDTRPHPALAVSA